ncbi:MAG TPA: CRTAC1 family protein [Methylomirabilota bacterium]|nr:CRTAC1 family protein [Methylomirabilota bacterium]
MRLWILGLGLSAAVAALPANAASPGGDTSTVVPSFAEETATAGISSVYDGEWEFMVGGGAATFDCDADGFPDLLLAGGAAPATLYRNAGTVGGPLRFEAHESGLEQEGVTGAYPLDVDADGVTDVILLRVGENIAMRGLGGCRFERANEVWAFDGGDDWSTALAATFEPGANWPTIAVGNYIDRTKGAMPWGSCTANRLHRPDANGRPAFAPPLALEPSFCALSMLFTDWNRSGAPSLRISNDREYYKGGQEQLWRAPPGGDPSLYTAEEGWKPLRIWGMGIASHDLDRDGFPEYFLTSMADNKLQTLAERADGAPPRPTYADVAFAKGATAHRPYVGESLKPSTAWHAQFEDVNNDGRADLFIAKGNVAEMPDFAEADPNNLLVQAADGAFREVGDLSGVASVAIARGAALTDFNLDGLVDLVVVNRWKPAEIWRNTSADAGRWIQMRLEQPGANRDGIGAWIEVRVGDAVTRREVTVGGGHAGGHLGWWHFGLGPDSPDTVDVRVIWPGGVAEDWLLTSDRLHILPRDAPARIWSPK